MKLPYNFKKFFTQKFTPCIEPIHDTEYFSNAHFLLKKDILLKSQFNHINTYPITESNEKKIQGVIPTLNKVSCEKNIAEFIPELIYINKISNRIAMKLGETYYAMNEQYYNFLNHLKCKVIISSENPVHPLSIYNEDNEFVGIVLPIKLPIKLGDESEKYFKNYNEYLEELQAETEQKKQGKANAKKCLYIKNNKAVVRNKELTCLADVINDQEYKNIYITNTEDAEVYVDLGIVCIYTRVIKRDYTPEDFKYYLNGLLDITLEYVLDDIRQRRNNNQFVNVADIKLLELSGASKEEVQDLINYRQAWYDRKEREEQELRQKEEQKDRDFVQEQNKKIGELVLATEQAILNKQEVKNKDITIYKDRYNSNTFSLILYTMKQNNINVPLKTQGWINNALASIQYNNEWNEYSYRFYKTSADSKVFYKYLNQLISKVKEKYCAEEEPKSIGNSEIDRLFGFTGYAG